MGRLGGKVSPHGEVGWKSEPSRGGWMEKCVLMGRLGGKVSPHREVGWKSVSSWGGWMEK